MRMTIAGPNRSGQAPKSAKLFQIIIVAIMVSLILFGLVLKGDSVHILIVVGCIIALFATLAICSIRQLPEHHHSSRRRSTTTDGYPMMDHNQAFPTTFDHTPPNPPLDKSWQPESISSVDCSQSYDSSPSFDCGSSFDAGSSSCGTSSSD